MLIATLYNFSPPYFQWISNPLLPCIVCCYRLLMGKLDEHGDDYRSAEVPVLWDVSTGIQ